MPEFIKFIDVVPHEASIKVYSNSTADAGTYVFDVIESNFSIDVARVTRVKIDVYTLYEPEFEKEKELVPLIAKIEEMT